MLFGDTNFKVHIINQRNLNNIFKHLLLGSLIKLLVEDFQRRFFHLQLTFLHWKKKTKKAEILINYSSIRYTVMLIFKL